MPDNWDTLNVPVRSVEMPIEKIEQNRITASPEKIDRTPQVRIADFSVEARHSPALSATTDTGVPYAFNWQPDFYVVVVRLTAGQVNVHIGGSRHPTTYFRLSSGTLKLPVHIDTLTIESVGATGFYDIYAVRNLDGFTVVS